MPRPSLSNLRSECIKSHELQCEEIADADAEPTASNQKREDKRNYDLLKEHQKSEIGQIIIYTPMTVQDWDIFSSGRVKRTISPRNANGGTNDAADAFDDFGNRRSSRDCEDAVSGRGQDFEDVDSFSGGRVEDRDLDDLDSPGLRLDLCQDFCDDGAALQRQTTSAVSSSVKPFGLAADAVLQKKLSIVHQPTYKKDGMRLVNAPGCTPSHFS